MQFRSWVLIASLIGNAAIVAAIVHSPSNPSATSASTTNATGEAGSGLFSRHSKSVKERPASGSTAAALPEFRWAEVESADYKEYIAKLRAIGCPEKTIRDIIVADVGKLYRPRLAALRNKPNSNYWQQNRFNPFRDQTPEQRKQTTALYKEQSELIKSLLGEDPEAEDREKKGLTDPYQQAFDALPKDKRDQLNDLISKANDARNEIYARQGRFYDPDREGDLAKINRKLREDMAAFLTPEQIEEYELRRSNTALSLREQAKTFEPSEAEFRALFRFKTTMEDNTVARGDDDAPPDPAVSKQLAQNQKDAEDALTQALGADRVKEYKTFQDYSFSSLANMDVPKDQIMKVVDIKQSAEDAARKLRGDKSLTADQRNTALQAIVDETQTQLRDMIGQREANYYMTSGGYWVRNLNPARPRP